MVKKRKLHFSCFVHKIINKINKKPEYLYANLPFQLLVHEFYAQRRSTLLAVSRHRKEVYKRSFTYSAVATLNSCMYSTLKVSDSSFQKYIKKLLETNPYNACKFYEFCTYAHLKPLISCFLFSLCLPFLPLFLFLSSSTKRFLLSGNQKLLIIFGPSQKNGPCVILQLTECLPFALRVNVLPKIYSCISIIDMY